MKSVRVFSLMKAPPSQFLNSCISSWVVHMRNRFIENCSARTSLSFFTCSGRKTDKSCDNPCPSRYYEREGQARPWHRAIKNTLPSPLSVNAIHTLQTCRVSFFYKQQSFNYDYNCLSHSGRWGGHKSEKVKLFGEDQMHGHMLLPPAKITPCLWPKP